MQSYIGTLGPLILVRILEGQINLSGVPRMQCCTSALHVIPRRYGFYGYVPFFCINWEIEHAHREICLEQFDWEICLYSCSLL